MGSILDRSASRAFAFVLLPEFSMMALTAAIEPLRHANHVLGEDHYSWSVYSESGGAVLSSSHLEVTPKGNLDAIDLQANIVVCGGPNIAAHGSPALLNWMRRAARHSPMIGGLCTAPRLLAEAGLLDGYRATIHWESQQAFHEAFPEVRVCESLYEFDRDRMTCAGETAGIDMMVALIAAHHGTGVATKVAAQVLHCRVRSASESQTPPQIRYATRNRRLLTAIGIMEANIEEPLPIEEVVRQLGCSRRQVERLFSRQLNCSPTAFYRNLRLDRARQLVTETRMNCMEIAVACGFQAASALSKAYEVRFGVTPYRERGIPSLGRNQPARKARGVSLAARGA